MENVVGLTKILSSTIEDLYYYFLLDTKSMDESSHMMSDFFIGKDSPYNNIYVNKNLDDNPVLYKNLSIIYISLKVYVSEIHNKEFGLALDTNEKIYNFLDNADMKSLLYKFYKDKNYRELITNIGVKSICATKDLTNYKELISLLKENKINKIMNIMPYFLMEYPDVNKFEAQDIIIDDTLEYYYSIVSQIMNEANKLKQQDSLKDNDDVEIEEEESLDEMSDEEREELKKDYEELTEYTKKQAEMVFKEIFDEVRNSLLNRYFNDPDCEKKIGFIIGNVYASLIERKDKLSESDLNLLKYLERKDVNLHTAYSQFLNNKDFGLLIMTIFIGTNMYGTVESRLDQESKLEATDKKYVKTMTKFDKYYREK